MGRYRRLARMRQMDPERDVEQIYRWITQYEFPRDYLNGTSVAFLRDYGVPRISRLLDRTQEFERAGQKRYDDTVLIAYEMVRDGMDSEHGRAAARHLNRIHGRYRIPNEDFLYVLATTVVGPKRWIDRFGWRPLCAQETESLALVGRRMGEMMGISHVPGTYAEFERLHDAYEREMFAYDPANRRVAAATLRVMAAWYPAPLRRIAVRASLAVLDEPLLAALGFRPQPAWLRAVVHRAFRLRAVCIRLLPARPERLPRRPKARTYPFGWTLDDLGPHWAQSRPVQPLPDEPPPETEGSGARPHGRTASDTEPSSRNASGVQPSGAEVSDAEPSNQNTSGLRPPGGEPSGVQPSSAELSDAEPSNQNTSGLRPPGGEPTSECPSRIRPPRAEPTDATPADAVPPVAGPPGEQPPRAEPTSSPTRGGAAPTETDPPDAESSAPEAVGRTAPDAGSRPTAAVRRPSPS
ncbi:hypothetical protein GA0115245_144024 [Streptomyces sp. di188]|nr:hypothetical protein GA0115238_105223 [Streptomyces sp. di50b]SCE49005.1 hypothetical protein GA0115245_144024 [Streptomyces sp. di188]